MYREVNDAEQTEISAVGARGGPSPHLLPHGRKGRVVETAALPVRAVDDQCVPGDEPAVRGSEERGRPPELLTSAHAHRRLARVLVARAVEVAADVVGHVLVWEEAGNERVDLDAVRAPLDGERLGEVLHARLGRGRMPEARTPRPGVGRADVDDRPRRAGRE